MKLKITAKCSDLCFSVLIDNEGNIIKEKHGYVPDGLGIGGNDYVEFTIDLKTGKIENWKPVTNRKKATEALNGV